MVQWCCADAIDTLIPGAANPGQFQSISTQEIDYEFLESFWCQLMYALEETRLPCSSWIIIVHLGTLLSLRVGCFYIFSIREGICSVRGVIFSTLPTIVFTLQLVDLF